MSLIQAIPATESVKDREISDILTAIRSNIMNLYRAKGNIQNSALTVSDLANIGIIGVDGSNIYSKVPNQSIVASRRASGSSAGSILSASATFDATSGASVGTTYLAITLPVNAVVIRAFYEVLISFAGGAGATIAISIPTDDVSGIVAPAALGSTWNTGWHECIQDGSAANFSEKTTAERLIGVDIGVNSLTDGKLNVYLQYVVSS